MDDWAAANIRQRDRFAAMCEAERLGCIERAARLADCGCTEGVLCRQNAACPRAKARKAEQQRATQRLHLAEAA